MLYYNELKFDIFFLHFYLSTKVYSPHQGNYGNVYDMHNDPQRNMQNESLNGMLRRYIAENARKLRKVKKKKRAASKNRRRSFAAVSRGGTAYNVAPYRKAFEAKPPTKKKPKQSKLAKKIYLLSNIIEKNRLLEEKRKIAELKALKLSKKKPTKSSLKSRLQKQMQLLKQSIENERMDRKIAKFARTQAMKEYRRNASK